MAWIIFILSLLMSIAFGERTEFNLSLTQAELPTTDVAYGADVDNKLDVYLPEGDGPFPVVLLIHGTDVSKHYFADTLTTTDLVNEGYAAVSIGYRVSSPDAPLVSIEDAACALTWIYANSTAYSFDTDNIIVFGHSRGATMAALLAVMDDLAPLVENCDYALPVANGIKAVITYGGSYATPEVSFSDPTFINALKRMSGMSDEQLQVLFDLLSTIPPNEWLTSPELPDEVHQFATYLPLSWLDGGEPPFLVVHGEVDEIAPAAEAEVFAQALETAGVSTTLVILPYMYHRLNQEALHEPLFKFLADVTAVSD